MFANNPMNCKNCEYKVINDDKSLHCYMFKNEPSTMCAQFKALPVPKIPTPPAAPAPVVEVTTATTPVLPEIDLDKSTKTSKRGLQEYGGAHTLSDTITSSDFLWGVGAGNVGAGLAIGGAVAAGLYWLVKD